MNNGIIEAILSVMIADTKEIFADKLDPVIPFGSYARGDFDAGSDIDILADVSADELSAYRSRVDRMCGELFYRYGIVVSVTEKDILTYNRYKNRLFTDLCGMIILNFRSALILKMISCRKAVPVGAATPPARMGACGARQINLFIYA